MRLLYNLIRRKAESKRVWFTWKVMLSICLAIFKVRLSETGDLGIWDGWDELLYEACVAQVVCRSHQICWSQKIHIRRKYAQQSQRCQTKEKIYFQQLKNPFSQSWLNSDVLEQWKKMFEVFEGGESESQSAGRATELLRPRERNSFYHRTCSGR